VEGILTGRTEQQDAQQYRALIPYCTAGREEEQQDVYAASQPGL